MAENQSLAPEKLIDKLTHAAHVGDNRGLEIFAACDDEILKQVLPHCTVDQLKYVEKCLKSKGRDLSPVTDKLWKKFYERKFGVQNANVLTQRMKERKMQGRSQRFLFGGPSCDANIFIKTTSIHTYIHICTLFYYIYPYVHTFLFDKLYIYTHPKKKSSVFSIKIIFDGDLL